ncbi:hypothetical protein ABPG74_001921 [Tetrahymena malaccensis]
MDKSLVQQLGKIHEYRKVPKELIDQYISKLEFCGRYFDYNDENKDIKEKNDRLYYLQQISDLLQESNAYPTLVLPHFEQLMIMIENNIFRPLPVQKKQIQQQVEPEIDINDVYVVASWSHLQPVYDIFLQVVVNEQMDVKILMKYISKKFIHQLLELFDSNEPREREYVKNLYHRLYGKLVQKRKTFRKAISFVFQTLIHERFSFNGMPELLDILASIISGYAVPLREEHIDFFKNIFIPLHKVQTSHHYHEQLQRCSMLFLSKMPELSLDLIDALLKYWPFANSTKELMFLSELLEVIEVPEMNKIQPYVERLFKRLIKCISGPHLQIADRAMCFFENEYFLGMLRQYKSITFPLIVPVIHKIADNHWHKILQESLIALRAILRELDPQAYEKSLTYKNVPTLYLSKDAKKRAEERVKVDEKWSELYKQAKKVDPSISQKTLPYTDKNVVGDFNGLENTNVVFN